MVWVRQRGVDIAVLLISRALARLLTCGGGRRAAPYAATCAARPCGIRTSHTSPRCRLGPGQRRAADDVSRSCSSFASSAETSPTSIRSSGLMNPSLIRKPPVRAIASRNGTAQWCSSRISAAAESLGMSSSTSHSSACPRGWMPSLSARCAPAAAPACAPSSPSMPRPMSAPTVLPSSTAGYLPPSPPSPKPAFARR